MNKHLPPCDVEEPVFHNARAGVQHGFDGAIRPQGRIGHFHDKT